MLIYSQLYKHFWFARELNIAEGLQSGNVWWIPDALKVRVQPILADSAEVLIW